MVDYSKVGATSCAALLQLGRTASWTPAPPVLLSVLLQSV